MDAWTRPDRTGTYLLAGKIVLPLHHEPSHLAGSPVRPHVSLNAQVRWESHEGTRFRDEFVTAVDQRRRTVKAPRVTRLFPDASVLTRVRTST